MGSDRTITVMIDALTRAPSGWYLGLEGAFTANGKDIVLSELGAGGALLTADEADAIRALRPGQMLELSGVMVVRRRW